MTLFDSFSNTVQDQTTAGPLEKLSEDDRKRREFLAALPDSEYALVVRDKLSSVRRLPMYSQDEWIESVAYFEAVARHELPPVLVKQAAARFVDRALALEMPACEPVENLLKTSAGFPPVALEWDDIQEHWERYVALRQPETEKTSASTEPLVEWSLEGVKGPDGSPLPFRIHCVRELVAAESWGNEHSTKLSSADKRRLARGILLGYAKMGFPVKTPSFVAKLSSVVRGYGGLRVRPDAPALIQDRVPFLKTSGVCQGNDSVFQKVSRAYEALSRRAQKAETLEEFEKIAAQVDALDRASGNEFPVSAHQSVFFGVDEDIKNPGRLKTSASEDSEVVYSSGATIIKGHQLKKAATLRLKPLEAYLGEGAVEEFRKDPVAVFKSLPLPHKKLVANYVEEKILSQHQGSEALME